MSAVSVRLAVRTPALYGWQWWHARISMLAYGMHAKYAHGEYAYGCGCAYLTLYASD